MENNSAPHTLDYVINNFFLDYSELNSKNSASIFTDDDIQILELNKRKEPNWKYIFFDWMPDTMKDLYFSKISKLYNHPNLLFIEGLQHEYGYNNHKINYSKSLELYVQGAKLNNQYCLFKLFYILQNSTTSDLFYVNKNIDLSIFFLIKASSYNETFLDLNKIDPIIKLMHIIYFKDKDLQRCRKLLEKMQFVNNEFNILIDNLELTYLHYFLRLNFYNSENEFRHSLDTLEKIAQQNHLEANYKLACLYYNPIHKEICKKNVEKSIQLFEFLFNKNYSKSYCSYYKICEEIKLYDKLESILIFSQKLKNFSSQFYANYLSKNRDEIFKNSKKIFKYFFYSFLYGNLISVVISFEIITQIFVKNLTQVKIENLEVYLRHIYDFVSTRKFDQNLSKVLDYDILILFHQIHAYFYYKGILVNKDVNNAIKILRTPFKDKKSIKNYRKVFYYLAKSYKKIGDNEKSNFYLKKTFDIYILLREFPYHHYIVAKILLRGIDKYIEKNIENAYYFFNLGASYKENFFFINSFYSQKCKNFITENKLILNFISKNQNNINNLNINVNDYINEEDICIVCYSNLKQIIFNNCGHRCLCFICFEKLNKNELIQMPVKCPMCKQENTDIINTFDFSVKDY